MGLTREATRRFPASEANRRPALRFTPYSWAKLTFLRDRGPTEVGGFGVTAEDDPLLVEDVRLVRQRCTAAAVRFDDAAVADHFDACVDAGLTPERFARVWVHTHPGDRPRPSVTDERTFARVFGGCDWAVMAILARGGGSYARLRFGVGPGGESVLPVEVDYSAPFAAADPLAWADDYVRQVVGEPYPRAARFGDESAGTKRGLAGAGAEPSLSSRLARFARRDAAESNDFHPSTSPAWEFYEERGGEVLVAGGLRR